MQINSYDDFRIFAKYIEKITEHLSAEEFSKRIAVDAIIKDVFSFLEFVEFLGASTKVSSFTKQRTETSLWHRKIFEHIVKLTLFYKNGFKEENFKEYFAFVGVDFLMKQGRLSEIGENIRSATMPCPWYCKTEAYKMLIKGEDIKSLLHGPEQLLKKLQTITNLGQYDLFGNKYHGLYGNWSDDIHSSLFNAVKQPHLGDSVNDIKEEIIVVGSELVGTLFCLIFLISGLGVDLFLYDFGKNNLNLGN